MEVFVVVLLGAAGYMATQLRSRTRPSDAETSPYSGGGPGQGVIGVDAGDRPSNTNGLYESRRLDVVRADETWRATDLARRALDPAHGNPGVVARYDREAPLPGTGDPFAYPGLGDGYGGGLKKPAGGTVHSQLLGRDVPVEEFRHNNEVAFYGGSVKQPSFDDTRGGGGAQGKLEAFTGSFEHRPLGRKKEIDALWAPTPQGVMTSGGRAAPDLDADRQAWLETMPVSRSRNNESPEGLAPEIVGRPGVRGGETGDTYYDMRKYALDRGVDELRPTSRPKLTFEGRVLPGAAIAPASDADRVLPVVREVHRPHLSRELTEENFEDQLLRTTGANIGVVLRPDDHSPGSLRSTNRQETDAASSYVGAAGGGVVRVGDTRERQSASRGTFREPSSTPQPGPAFLGSSRAGDAGRGASVLVYGNNRDVTTVRTHKGNLVGAVKAIIAPLADALRVTKKEDASIVNSNRAFGNAGAAVGVPKLTVYDAADVARTTIKQTTATLEATLANMSGGAYKIAIYNDDRARTGKRETMLTEATTLNMAPSASRKAIVYDPEDVARVSRKQTTISEMTRLNVAPSSHYASIVYDPADVARVSRKETTLAEAPAGNVGGGTRRAGAVATDQAMRTTVRQTVGDVDPARHMSAVGVHVGTVYDSEAWAPATTLKQVVAEHSPALGSIGAALQGGTGGYSTAEFDARTTMRQLSDTGAPVYGQAGPTSRAVGGYEVAPDDIKDTQKQTLSDIDYFGGSIGEALPTSHESAAAMETLGARGDLEGRFVAHTPTPSSVRLSTSFEALGAVQTVSTGGLGRISREPSPGRASPAFPGEGQFDGFSPEASQLGVISHNRFQDDVVTQVSGDRLAAEAVYGQQQRSGNPVAILNPGASF